MDEWQLLAAKAETDAFLEAWAVQKAGLKAEQRLARKVSGLFGTIQEGLIAELNARGLPDTPAMRQAMEESLADSLAPLHSVLEEAEYMEAEGAAERIAGLASKGGILIDAAEGLYSAVDDHFLSQHIFEASAHTMARVTRDVMKTIYDGYEAGKGVKDVAKMVNDRFTRLKGYEAKRIARTEINYAQNHGSYSSMQTYGVEYHKWVTGLDARVRGSDPQDKYSHVALHGQVVKVGDPFQNGLRYPHDRGGVIGEWINCRCTTVPWFPPAGYMAPPGQAWWNENDYVERPSGGQTDAGLPVKDKRNWETPNEWVNTEQYAALNEYTGAAYSNVNALLRGKELPGMYISEARTLEMIDAMDSAFKAAPKHPALTVYRGTCSKRVVDACKPGGEISDLGYMSTSHALDVASDFTSDSNTRAIFHINVPEGKKGINVEDLSKLPEEREFLLDRGSTLRIDRVEPGTNTYGRDILNVFVTLL